MALGAGPEMFHLLRPRNTLAFVAAFCVFTGWRTGAAGLWALGLASGGILLLAFACALRWLRGIEGAREHPERAFQEEEVAVETRLRTRSLLPHFLLETRDTFAPGGARPVRALFPGVFRRGHGARVSYRETCVRHRGLYVIGPARAVASDPLGLFTREEPLELFTTLLVYPQAPGLRGLALLEEGVWAHVGVETVRREGQSEEFIGLGDYRAGDSPRRVHWPSSLRHGRLLVKRFQDERTTEVTICLDLGRLGLTGLGDQSTVEYGIRAAATLARQAFERGHATQLIAVGETVERVPPGSGLQHLLAVLDRLVFLKSGGERDFAEEIKRLRPVLRRGSTAALIFSAATLRLDALAPLIEDLRQQRVRALVILLDDRTFPKLYREQERLHAAGPGVEEAALRLRLLGARVHVLARHSHPAEAIRRGLGAEAAQDGSGLA